MRIWHVCHSFIVSEIFLIFCYNYFRETDEAVRTRKKIEWLFIDEMIIQVHINDTE